MKKKKELNDKEIERKITDLKIELLKQPLKKKRIKKEIARLLTMNKSNSEKTKESMKNKSGGKQ